MTAAIIIKKALSYAGTKESPANSNNVIFNTHYYGRPVSGSSYPWCAVFLWDIFRLCGASDLFCGGKKTAYTPSIYEYYKSKGMTHSTPKVGDLVFFKFPGSNRINHIGLVIEVKGKNNIKTIEGNTSTGNNCNGGCVMVRTRTSSIVGYARPAYSDTKKTTKKTTSMSSKSASTTYTTAKFVKEVETILGIKNPDTKPNSMTLKLTPTLSTSKNSTHACVKCVQKLLKAKKYDIKVTEKYDNQTAQAVKKYQKAHDGTVDGIMDSGQKTWKSLLGL